VAAIAGAAALDPRTFGIWLPSDLPLPVGDVTISSLSDPDEGLVQYGELWVPRAFTANFDRPPLPLLELRTALVGGRFRCIELRVSARDEADYIETKHLRDVRVVELIKEAAALVAYISVELEDEEDVAFAREAFLALADLDTDAVQLDSMGVGDYFRYPVLTPLIAGDHAAHDKYLPFATDQLVAASHRRHRGIASDDDVAEVYRKAWLRGEQVIDAVADAFGWPRQTAKNRIHRARARGHLPETIAGRAQG
jgi:hypothetical protein